MVQSKFRLLQLSPLPSPLCPWFHCFGLWAFLSGLHVSTDSNNLLFENEMLLYKICMFTLTCFKNNINSFTEMGRTHNLSPLPSHPSHTSVHMRESCGDKGKCVCVYMWECIPQSLPTESGSCRRLFSITKKGDLGLKYRSYSSPGSRTSCPSEVKNI